MFPDVQQSLLNLVLQEAQFLLSYPDPCFYVICHGTLVLLIPARHLPAPMPQDDEPPYFRNTGTERPHAVGLGTVPITSRQIGTVDSSGPVCRLERVGEIKNVFAYVQKALLDLVLHEHELFFEHSNPCFSVVCQLDLSVPVGVIAGLRFKRPRLPHVQDRRQLIGHNPGYAQHVPRLRFDFDGEFVS